MIARGLFIFVVGVLFLPAFAHAQTLRDRFELGGQRISANVSRFDQAEVGIGIRFTWNSANRILHDDSSFGHDVRLAAGAGLRF